MTRIEECFPPDIVRAVYQRLNNDESRSARAEQPTAGNVINLSAYRQNIASEGQKVVS